MSYKIVHAVICFNLGAGVGTFLYYLQQHSLGHDRPEAFDQSLGFLAVSLLLKLFDMLVERFGVNS